MGPVMSRSCALALVTESARIAAESTRSFILHPSRRIAATIARFERTVFSNSPRGAE
jgi:hypothetical protein